MLFDALVHLTLLKLGVPTSAQQCLGSTFVGDTTGNEESQARPISNRKPCTFVRLVTSSRMLNKNTLTPSAAATSACSFPAYARGKGFTGWNQSCIPYIFSRVGRWAEDGVVE